MSTYLFYSPQFRPLSPDGSILPGAHIQFYATGTTTPTDVYADADLTTPLSNPVEADASGEFVPIYLDPAVTYRALLFNEDDEELWDIDPLAPPRDYAPGTVLMFMGTEEALETAYPPALWQQCDGTNGTYDMRDRSPIGVSGSLSPGDTIGGSGTVNTTSAGAHDHGGVTGETTITEAQMPEHVHGGWYNTAWERGVPPTGSNRSGPVIPTITKSDGSVTDTSLNSLSTDTPMTTATGGDEAHDHSISSDGDHIHQVSVVSPAVALWFIMRRAI